AREKLLRLLFELPLPLGLGVGVGLLHRFADLIICAVWRSPAPGISKPQRLLPGLRPDKFNPETERGKHAFDKPVPLAKGKRPGGWLRVPDVAAYFLHDH